MKVELQNQDPRAQKPVILRDRVDVYKEKNIHKTKDNLDLENQGQL